MVHAKTHMMDLYRNQIELWKLKLNAFQQGSDESAGQKRASYFHTFVPLSYTHACFYALIHRSFNSLIQTMRELTMIQQSSSGYFKFYFLSNQKRHVAL